MRVGPALWSLFGALVLATGCKKEKDGTPPTVEILAPSQNSTLSVPSLLTVRVRVSDDRELRSLSITLLNASSIPITAPIVVELSGTSATIERTMSITDERIPTGSYTLEVRATDGENDRRAFRSVNVTAAPLRLRSVFVTSPFGTTPATVIRMDSVGTITTWTAVPELCASAVDGYSQHLFLAGCASAPLIAVPTASGNTWQVTDQNALPLPYFTSVTMDPFDDRLYVSSNDGFVRGFSGDGAQSFTAQTQADLRPYATAMLGGSVLVEERSISLPQAKLTTYTAVGGNQLLQWPLDQEVIAMFRVDGQKALVIGGRSGQCVIEEHRADLGSSNELQVLTDGAPVAAVRMDPNTYAIALPGRVVRYTRNSNSIATLAPIDATTLAFDEAEGQLIAGNGNQLSTIDPNSGAVINSVTMPIAIGSILPLLNR